MTQTVITNNVPRPMMGGWQLTSAERAAFDYLDDIDDGSFFRYRGQVYDIGEFMPADGIAPKWDGIATDTYFSAIVIKICHDGESVIVGRI